MCLVSVTIVTVDGVKRPNYIITGTNYEKSGFINGKPPLIGYVSDLVFDKVC